MVSRPLLILGPEHHKYLGKLARPKKKTRIEKCILSQLIIPLSVHQSSQKQLAFSKCLHQRNDFLKVKVISFATAFQYLLRASKH